MLAPDIGMAVEATLTTDPTHGFPRVRRELPVSMGEGRIDVAAVSGRLVGFEIKSAADGLARLERQVELYGRVVDEAVLVIERRHPERLLNRLPSWWGLWSAVVVGSGCQVHVLREPEPNPRVEPFATAQLLWRGEVMTLLRSRGEGRGLSGANRWQLWTRAAAVVPLDQLREYVRSALTARRGW